MYIFEKKNSLLKTIYCVYCVGDPCMHFLYDIVYQQQHNSRDSNACLSDGSFGFPMLDLIDILSCYKYFKIHFTQVVSRLIYRG